jgi:RNA polymerase sigma-70 factor (ECF subfamily)
METSRRYERLSLNDRDLVVAFKEGDEHAYDEIYRRHSPKIRVVCSRRLSHDHDAEEALQETFLRAYQALPRFNGQYKLGAWLNRIAINVCIDQLRGRSKAEIVRDIEESALEPQGGPEESLAASRPDVLEALGELKPLHARALKLQAVDGLSHLELAGTLAMTPAQVKSLLHRARLSFKRVLKGASGWLTAPLGFLRRPRDADAVPVGGGAAQTMGLFAAMHASLPTAERVLTGTVAAALALTATTPSSPIGSRRADKSAALVQGERTSGRSTAKTVIARPNEKKSSEVSRPAGDAGDEVVDVSQVPAAVDEVVEHVQLELAKHEKKNKKSHVSRPTSLDPDEVKDEADRKLDRTEAAAVSVAQNLKDF